MVQDIQQHIFTISLVIILRSGHPGAGGKEGGEYSDGPGDGGSRRYGAAFHAAKETVVSGPTDVGHEATGTGGAVPD